MKRLKRALGVNNGSGVRKLRCGGKLNKMRNISQDSEDPGCILHLCTFCGDDSGKPWEQEGVFAFREGCDRGRVELEALVAGFDAACAIENGVSDKHEYFEVTEKRKVGGTKVGQGTFLAGNFGSGVGVFDGVGTFIRGLSMDKVNDETRAVTRS